MANPRRDHSTTLSASMFYDVRPRRKSRETTKCLRFRSYKRLRVTCRKARCSWNDGRQPYHRLKNSSGVEDWEGAFQKFESRFHHQSRIPSAIQRTPEVRNNPSGITSSSRMIVNSLAIVSWFRHDVFYKNIIIPVQLLIQWWAYSPKLRKKNERILSFN